MAERNRDRHGSLHENIHKSNTLGTNLRNNTDTGQQSRKNLLHERLNAIKKGEKSAPREKYNSTSTTYVDSTIQNPDKKILIRWYDAISSSFFLNDL